MNHTKQDKLKEKLKERKFTLGSWITIGHPIVAEIMANSGFDWLTIDMEHSAITLDIAQDMIRTIELSGCIPLVRVEKNDACIIKRVLDAGAHGVIIPNVNSKQDAENAVNSVRYPPHGKRGVGLARAQKYGFGFEEYKNKKLIVIVQIESTDAIDNLEEILSVDGIDGSIIGPYDLSASIGYPGKFERKEVVEKIKRYETICKKNKKTMGIHVIPTDWKEVDKKIKEGFTFIAFSLDTIFLGIKIKEELELIKKNE